MALETSDLIAISVPVLAATAAVLGYLSRLSHRGGLLEQRIVSVETKVNLFWKVVETEIPRLLKAPHTEEFDGLLDKFQEKKADYDELKKLKAIIEMDLTDKDGPPGRKLAELLLLPAIQERMQKLDSKGKP